VNNEKNLWKKTLNELKLTLSDRDYNLWFTHGGLEFIFFYDNIIYLKVPHSYYKERFENKFLTQTESLLNELNTEKTYITLKLILNEDEIPNQNKDENLLLFKEKFNKDITHPLLNKKYTFNQFVVGENNKFAFNAANAIAQHPGTAYNPCLIYGGVGLGKTHLMQSIGNQIYNNNPSANILYITAENFINEFIESIKTTSTSQFKKKYRHVDILLIDDIHDLQNKKETQEELFHTFNALYDSNKQMIFTCDRPPYELKNFTERLQSRFERGLNVDLQAPSWETRYAIIEKKIEVAHFKLDKEIIELIAKNITTNIRDLEAAITKVQAIALLEKQDPTIDLVNKNLFLTFEAKQKKDNINIDITTIKKIVAEEFNIKVNDIDSNKRQQPIAKARQLAIYFSRELTDLSSSKIAKAFFKKDHTTILHAYNKIHNDHSLEMQNLKEKIQFNLCG